MSGKYDDIICLPHHVSLKHPRMSAMDRAAQFSPFSALTGLGAQINETARRTDQRLELDEYAKIALNDTLQLILERIHEYPQASISYFVPDSRKEGGAYETVTGAVRKLDLFQGVLLMTDETRIPIEEIYEIEMN